MISVLELIISIHHPFAVALLVILCVLPPWVAAGWGVGGVLFILLSSHTVCSAVSRCSSGALTCPPIPFPSKPSPDPGGRMSNGAAPSRGDRCVCLRHRWHAAGRATRGENCADAAVWGGGPVACFQILWIHTGLWLFIKHPRDVKAERGDCLDS